MNAYESSSNTHFSRRRQNYENYAIQKDNPFYFLLNAYCIDSGMSNAGTSGGTRTSGGTNRAGYNGCANL